MAKARLLEEEFPEAEGIAHARGVGDTTSFSELVQALDLSPTRDFRHADLVGVDFSGSDLSSYDFTGADLRGSFGIGVRIDGAILTDAQTASSLFSYRDHRRDYFADRPQAARTLKSLSSEHWIRATNWVAENVLAKRSPEAVEIASALFLATKDRFLKNQILLFLRPAFGDRVSYLDFLLETLNTHGDDEAIRRSVVGAMGTFFADQRSVYEILKREIAATYGTIQLRILSDLARSRHSSGGVSGLRQLIYDNASPVNRRAFVRGWLLARISQFYVVVSDEALLGTMDFGARIPAREITAAARRVLHREVKRKGRASPLWAYIDGGMPDYAVERRVERMVELLRLMDQLGFDISAEPDPRQSSSLGSTFVGSVDT